MKNVFRKQHQVVEVMCKAALPSTLVKALYLFFDLPPPVDESVALSRQKLLNVFQKVSIFDEGISFFWLARKYVEVGFHEFFLKYIYSSLKGESNERVVNCRRQ